MGYEGRFRDQEVTRRLRDSSCAYSYAIARSRKTESNSMGLILEARSTYNFGFVAYGKQQCTIADVLSKGPDLVKRGLRNVFT